MSSRPSAFTLSSAGRTRLYSTSELLQMDPPSWLIEGVVPHGGLVGLYAQPASFKSFLAIDLALSVSTGVLWQGRDAGPGAYVLYISAEGGVGIGKRVHAWLQHHQLESRDTQIAWMLEAIPVYAGSEEIDQLITRIHTEVEREPVLVIIDTLARCFDGDENQQQDMGRFIAGVDYLRHLWECAVLVVHHTRLDGDRERGNTAFRGAADTMIAVERIGIGAHAATRAAIKLTCTKQKDAEEFAPMKLRVCPVDGTDSCVIQAIAGVPGNPREVASDGLTRRVTLWAHLEACATGLTFDQWLGLTEVPKATFYRDVMKLEASGCIHKSSGNVWTVVPHMKPRV